MIFWLFFHLVIIFFGLPTKINNRKFGKSLLIIVFVYIIAISSIRYDIGFDYGTYYRSIHPYIDNSVLDTWEPLNRLIFIFCARINCIPLVFVVYSVLTYVIAFYSIYKYSKDAFIGLLVYIAFFYLTTLSSIRQGLALSIILLATGIYIYGTKRRFLQFASLCVIASFFHYSAIICLFIPLLFNLQNLKSILIIDVAIYTFLSALITLTVTFIIPQYATYLLSLNDFEGGGLITIFYTLFVCLCIYTVYKSYHLRKLPYELRTIAIIIIGVIIPYIMGTHIGGRISMYFLVPLVYLVPVIFKKKFQYKILVPLLCCFFMFYIYTDSKNTYKSSYTPYQTIFDIDNNNPKWK